MSTYPQRRLAIAFHTTTMRQICLVCYGITLHKYLNSTPLFPPLFPLQSSFSTSFAPTPTYALESRVSFTGSSPFRYIALTPDSSLYNPTAYGSLVVPREECHLSRGPIAVYGLFSYVGHSPIAWWWVFPLNELLTDFWYITLVELFFFFAFAIGFCLAGGH